HHDEQDGLVPEERKSWSQWRGYDKVLVRKGAAGGQQTITSETYFRGMDGDPTSSGTPKSVSITDSTGVSKQDLDPLAGVQRENDTFTNAGTIRERSINEPWLSGATATRTRSWGTAVARHLEEANVRQSEATPSGGWQDSGSDNVYDNNGVLLQSNDS